ncbi:MAG: DUF4159 domain-containing protein, partial [Nitrospinae bacterium]|nr:DUF4159 domain-containing protein [Nitrospinota bacterium]
MIGGASSLSSILCRMDPVRLNLFILTACLQAGILMPGSALALGDASKIAIPQIQYEGGNYQPRPHAVGSLLAQIAKRTSIEVNRKPLSLKPGDPRLYRYPFIYMGGRETFHDVLQHGEMPELLGLHRTAPRGQAAVAHHRLKGR